jgi:hypothetical protein
MFGHGPGGRPKWTSTKVDESHTRLHEDILLEEQIGRSGFAGSAGALHIQTTFYFFLRETHFFPRNSDCTGWYLQSDCQF